MGMFDEVIVACPYCNMANELQSKAGKCVLATYVLSNAPMEVLADISKKSVSCEHCGKVFRIRLQCVAFTDKDAFTEDDEDYDYD